LFLLISLLFIIYIIFILITLLSFSRKAKQYQDDIHVVFGDELYTDCSSQKVTNILFHSKKKIFKLLLLLLLLLLLIIIIIRRRRRRRRRRKRGNMYVNTRCNLRRQKCD